MRFFPHSINSNCARVGSGGLGGDGKDAAGDEEEELETKESHDVIFAVAAEAVFTAVFYLSTLYASLFV